MDREILFHGKRKDNGEWVEGYYTHVGPTNDMRHYIIPYYASAFYGIEVDPSTVGQYTGLTDKHGKRVFKGDVCWDGYAAGKFVVDWDDNLLTWIAKFRDIFEYLSSVMSGGFEIIGNIHDTPELMEGKA